MMEGTEYVSHLITRYATFENLYLKTSFKAKEQLEQSLVKLYAAMMRYLVRAGRYYRRNTTSVFGTIPIPGIIC